MPENPAQDGRSESNREAELAEFYSRHAESLTRFLKGVLKDNALAQDVTQTAFARLLENGGEIAIESRKAWLYQVAYREALVVRRRSEAGRRAREQAYWLRSARQNEDDESTKSLERAEETETILRALRSLPEAQQQIVRMRIYEAKTFARIAEELEIPLGTALSRMRAALKKLREDLHDRQGE